MKSKGTVTYWALRERGKKEILALHGTAHTHKQLELLNKMRDKHNRNRKKLGFLIGRVELVRVEVTPV